MQGITVFPSLAAALANGYQIYDRDPAGFLVRIKTPNGWALARVDLRAS